MENDRDALLGVTSAELKSFNDTYGQWGLIVSLFNAVLLILIFLFK